MCYFNEDRNLYVQFVAFRSSLTSVPRSYDTFCSLTLKLSSLKNVTNYSIKKINRKSLSFLSFSHFYRRFGWQRKTHIYLNVTTVFNLIMVMAYFGLECIYFVLLRGKGNVNVALLVEKTILVVCGVVPEIWRDDLYCVLCTSVGKQCSLIKGNVKK